MPTITLSPLEIEVVEMVVNKRMAFQEKVDATATFYGVTRERTTRENELIGYAGEYAFCVLFNLYPDFVTDQFRPYDCKLHTGHTVDVKTATDPHARLMVKLKTVVQIPDLYALMTGTMPTFTFRGFAIGTEIRRANHLNRTLEHPAYTMQQEELSIFIPDRKEI